MYDAYLLLVILALTFALFIWGYFRYDTVALISLLTLVCTGLVPAQYAFLGFGNSAVISVAAVMIISAVIIQSGLIEKVLLWMKPILTTPFMLIAFICVIAGVLSAFMNNVGALSLLMPVAIQSAINVNLSPSKILMPLSFATILGGMTTKIGTPPNLLIASYRENLTGVSFSMFDFFPVGFIVAASGLLFIILLGWRLVPARRKVADSSSELYQIKDYISEARITEKSPLAGIKRQDVEELIEGHYAILGLIRGRTKKLVIPPNQVLLANDILIIQASHDVLEKLLLKGGLELIHGDIVSPERLYGPDISTIEAVVTPGSRIHGRSWQRLRVRSQLGLNLLAIARAGKSIRKRLNHVNFNPGDVLLIQGESEDLQETVVSLGLVPLAQRQIGVGFKRSILLPLLLFITGIILTALQLLPIEIAFTGVVVAMVILNVIPMRDIYRNIDWAIIVMLGALIPLGEALKHTGAATLIGTSLLALTGNSSLIFILGLLLVITMTLSDVMNNTATAVIMAPIAADLAELLHKSPDPFLMAVAIGASCSCLTPISHQNNTLIMGPGGYKFFDYLSLGIPLEVIVLLTALPALFIFWL